MYSFPLLDLYGNLPVKSIYVFNFGVKGTIKDAYSYVFVVPPVG